MLCDKKAVQDSCPSSSSLRSERRRKLQLQVGNFRFSFFAHHENVGRTYLVS